MDSTARISLEAELCELYDKHLSSLKSSNDAEVAKRELEDAIVRQSKASCLDISAKLTQLPRELRDTVYNYMLEERPYNRPLVHFFPRDVVPPSPCCSSSPSSSICPCSTGLVHFLNPDFMGETIALEILDAFKTDMRAEKGRRYRPNYSLHWSELKEFASRELFHLDTTLHELCEDMRLSVRLNFADVLTEKKHTERLEIGLSTATDDAIQSAVQALSTLRSGKPRRITFAFSDEALEGPPKNMDQVFCALGVPFRELKSAGFDMRLTDTSGDRDLWWDGFGHWKLSSNYWNDCLREPWSWTLRDWSVNFTMTNYQFQPSGMGGDRYTPNPHGPVNKPHKDFRQKLQVWESLRRELYQSFVEIDEAVKLVDRGDGKIFVDCGCEADGHTCCEYYLCDTHGGWDNDSDGSNTYCYKCLGIEAVK
ncbi:hypothetical protein HBI81_194060 [Parastagonospora nodorum]|nr:hypothetical protein HBI10_218090 [Parastagonospora nodorum]KAH4010175.1 hypothetical protein HBI13_210290 [Parastagonospora nodorum]KAH4049948.1 hypothetical protein HBH49_139980 [Parastagonospora nodorum]KAH4195457.1 hypothetical protein HBI95_193410 [Parastagonospora nodorum]KAH4801673.1 hypothetical protein HBH61_192400 [Parastagonospora nodorum]